MPDECNGRQGLKNNNEIEVWAEVHPFVENIFDS